MKNQFCKDNVFELSKRWNNSTDNYPGAIFVSIYNKYPENFWVYFNKDHQLAYQSCADSMPIEKNDSNKVYISPKKLIKNLLDNKNKLPINIFPYSPNEFIVFGDSEREGGKDFVMILVNGDEVNTGHWYEEIFCEGEDIEYVFNI